MVIEKTEINNKNRLLTVFFAVSCIIAVVAFLVSSPSEIFGGLMNLIISPQSLTSDTIAIAGIGGAMLNAALCGIMAALVIKLSHAKITGTSIAAFCLGVGFAFLGVNILNFAVLILGSYLFSVFDKKPFAEYANFSIFSGAVAPIVSEMLFGKYLQLPLIASIPAGLLAGIVIGAAFPIVCRHTSALHKGYDLFNAGVAGGFIAMAFFGLYKNVILKIAKQEFAMNSLFGGKFNKELLLFSIPALLIFLAGVILNKGFKGYGKLLSESGHQADFLDKYGLGVVLINFGLVYMVVLAYFELSDFQWTAAAIASLLGAAAWAGAGSHPKNVLPILIGYALFSLLTGTPLNNTTLTIGVGYATGLSPVSGKFGILWGILCGFIHAAVVFNTAAVHGGFCLYNGGFTAGLVCVVMVPVMEYFASRKKEK